MKISRFPLLVALLTFIVAASVSAQDRLTSMPRSCSYFNERGRASRLNHAHEQIYPPNQRFQQEAGKLRGGGYPVLRALRSGSAAQDFAHDASYGGGR